MREISLHILDLIENSIRAGVTVISVTIEEDHKKDLLQIIVEDNGRGLPVSPEDALDPFFTTKHGKRVGLGLSLFRGAAQRADGNLEIGKSDLGGVKVTVTMKLSHIDRMPMGDLAATFSSLVCTNPQIELRFKFCVGDRKCVISTSEVADQLKVGELRGLAVAREVSEKIKQALVSVESRA